MIIKSKLNIQDDMVINNKFDEIKIHSGRRSDGSVEEKRG